MAVQQTELPKIRSTKWYGMRPSIEDKRDKWFKRKALRLPRAVDLSHEAPPVMNQGMLGSCVANGITACMRTLMIRKGMPAPMLSRLQLYYDGRVVEDCVNEDTGLEVRDGVKCAQKLGVAREALWPYEVQKFKDKPTEDVYVDAERYQVLAYERVEVDAGCIRQALARGFPVLIGISLFSSFESDAVEKNGMVPLPNYEDESIVGGHLMVAYGYGQKQGRFKVLNSWGEDWGDKGFCYIPEKYVGDPKIGSDYWIITDAEMVQT